MSATDESAAARQILRTYATLTLLSTFASSTIWGINTLFLLDAGLSVSEAFMANAFFTVGMVAFEVPTGVVADAVGRRASYLLGVATLFASTLLYLLMWQRASSDPTDDDPTDVPELPDIGTLEPAQPA